MKKSIILSCLFITVAAFVNAQQDAAQATTSNQTRETDSQFQLTGRDRTAENEERLRLAVSSLDYPVTPGDVYRLIYRQTSEMLVSRDLIVNANNVIDLNIFGKIDANGMSFVDLKRSVEDLISKSYLRSLPSLTIISPGIFRVSVRGNIPSVQYINGWGLSKLSEIVASIAGPTVSLRNVEVAGRDGESRTYDLQKGMRTGASGQDPYVKPGDAIILHPTQRMITLSGEIQQPGAYELVQGEGIRELIEVFGGGLTGMADPSSVRIGKARDRRSIAQYVRLPQAYDDSIDLSDGDTVNIASKKNRQTVVWFEGAVSNQLLDLAAAHRAPGVQETGDAAAISVPPTGSQYERFAYPVWDGEMLSDVLNEIKTAILPAADLTSAVLIRTGSTRPMRVNLQPLLFEFHSFIDIPLNPNDIIFIPVARSTISVAGAVITPGIFPFQPGFPPSYYVSMAGGIDPERNCNGSFWVADSKGKHRKSDEQMAAGDRIYVPINSLGYKIERIGPLVITLVTGIISTITLINLLNNRQ